jgi:uncharacterized protein YeaO (DUF488 family)
MIQAYITNNQNVLIVVTLNMIKIKRIYEAPARGDGYRILVDRLWPRGIKKENAEIDKWVKDIAPSTALRKWFNHEAEKWVEFKKKYRAELKDASALDELKQDMQKHKTITLLYGAKDEVHNQAVALVEIVAKYAAK